MLPSALVDDLTARISSRFNGSWFALSYQCPCREAWWSEAEQWATEHGLMWRDQGMGIRVLDFIDKTQATMFKLALCSPLGQPCRH